MIRSLKFLTKSELEHVGKYIGRVFLDWVDSLTYIDGMEFVTDVVALYDGDINAKNEMSSLWHIVKADELSWVAAKAGCISKAGFLQGIGKSDAESSTQPSTMADSLDASMAYDLCSVLIKSIFGSSSGARVYSESNTLPKAAFSYGSGAARVRLQYDAIMIEFILSNAATDVLCKNDSSGNEKLTALAPVSTLLEKRSVILDAVLGAAEISISEMLNLSVGDVIRIDRSVTDHIDITLDSSVLCHGVLGYHDGDKALQLKYLDQ